MTTNGSITFLVRHHTTSNLWVGRVYEITITDTGRTDRRVTKRPYKLSKEKKGNIPLKTDNCSKCGDIEIDGICINKKCGTTIATDNA